MIGVYPLQIGIGKLIVMLLVTWLTPFVGLGNLILLWANPHYRKRAITALGIAIASSLVATVLIHLIGLAKSLHIIALLIVIGMRIWMTIDAVYAYKVYKASSWW